MDDQSRRIRYQAALTECARALLASTGQRRLEYALEALLTATEAAYVFVERNVNHPQLGFCSQTVAEAETTDNTEHEVDSPYWELVPWARMPISRSHLERGEPFVVIPDQLEGPEYELYAADPYPIKSELNIPIHVEGRWEGLIGFADNQIAREWPEEDVELLTTAASMIGAFWEREMSRDRLEQLIRDKNDFVATVSHELRTPLTTILGLSQELAAGLENFARQELEELLAAIADQSSEMAHLIEDLLVAARVDIGEVTVLPTEVDLRSALDEVAAMLPGSSNGRFRADGSAVAWADPTRVRQIIRNLLTNAERYGGSEVTATVGLRHERAELVVRDNGPGIREDRRDRVFERYERDHTRAGMTQSIGIGLTVSRQLAQLMQGDLTYAYEGGWSIFTLTLPTEEALLDSNTEMPAGDEDENPHGEASAEMPASGIPVR